MKKTAHGKHFPRMDQACAHREWASDLTRRYSKRW